MSAASQVAVDWGSSSFRAYLLDENFNCIDKVNNTHGVFSLKKTFAETLQEACGAWFDQNQIKEVLLAGMAGSRSGWKETSYSQCPVSAKKHKQAAVTIESEFTFKVEVLPGVQALSPSDFPDVMRGEEVQLFGVLDNLQKGSAIVCLPGTHSKWVDLESKNIESFATLMTGELFALLKEHSSIGILIKETKFDQASFLKGVTDQKNGSAKLNNKVALLHSLFSVRAGTVSNNLQVQSVYWYLSGLLLADEISSARAMFNFDKDIVIISDEKLSEPYRLVLNQFGLQPIIVDSEMAFLQGIKSLMQ